MRNIGDCGLRRSADDVPSLLLEARGISKSFGGVRALSDVSFDLRAGEVHALVGENGAGKSTLIKIMTGAERADAGTLVVAGTPVPHIDPHTARALGIAAIYQQPSLFPHLTVAENIALALESGGAVAAAFDWKARRAARGGAARRASGAPIDPDRLVESLSMPEQQVVEIAKAIGADARILIMDEPTASLSDARGGAAVRRHRAAARSTAPASSTSRIVSRRLPPIADRITVLRDGETVATRGDQRRRPRRADPADGRPRAAAVFPKRTVALGEIALETRRLDRPRAAASTTCRSSFAAARFSASPGWSARGGPSSPRRSSACTPADCGRDPDRTARPSAIASPADAIRLGHRLRARGSPPARRHSRDVGRGQRQPGESAAPSRAAA